MAFLIFQDGSHLPLGFVLRLLGTTHEEQLMVFIDVQKLVGIDNVVSNIYDF